MECGINRYYIIRLHLESDKRKESFQNPSCKDSEILPLPDSIKECLPRRAYKESGMFKINAE